MSSGLSKDTDAAWVACEELAARLDKGRTEQAAGVRELAGALRDPHIHLGSCAFVNLPLHIESRAMHIMVYGPLLQACELSVERCSAWCDRHEHVNTMLPG